LETRRKAATQSGNPIRRRRIIIYLAGVLFDAGFLPILSLLSFAKTRIQPNEMKSIEMKSNDD
jgi:hypothetical protein